MPFFDPYVPLYDPVRDAPAFIELLEELSNSA